MSATALKNRSRRVCLMHSFGRSAKLRDLEKLCTKPAFFASAKLEQLASLQARVDNSSQNVASLSSYRQLATLPSASHLSLSPFRQASATLATPWRRVINGQKLPCQRSQVSITLRTSRSSLAAIDNHSLRIPTTTEFSFTY